MLSADDQEMMTGQREILFLGEGKLRFILVMNILIPLTGDVSNNQTLTSWLVGRLASAGNL